MCECVNVCVHVCVVRSVPVYHLLHTVTPDDICSRQSSTAAGSESSQ